MNRTLNERSVRTGETRVQVENRQRNGQPGDDRVEKTLEGVVRAGPAVNDRPRLFRIRRLLRITIRVHCTTPLR